MTPEPEAPLASKPESTSKKNEAISPLQYMKGIGPRRAAALAKEGILAPADILQYAPRSYIDRDTAPSLRQVRNSLEAEQSGNLLFNDDTFRFNSQTTVIATVRQIRDKTFGKNRTMVVVVIDDGSGVGADIVYWNQANYFKRIFSPNDLIAVSGKPELGRTGRVQFHHPDVDIIEEEDIALYTAGTILPKYRLTQAMKDAGVTQRLLRTMVADIIETTLPLLHDPLPDEVRKKYDLPPITAAWRELHFPSSRATLQQAHFRMKFEEIFYFSIALALRRLSMGTTDTAPAMTKRSTLARTMLDSLPFDLTHAQKRVVREIVQDLSNTKPMNRLLQGDVGSGKTIVALLSMLVAIDNGYQCVLMAPTEILAEQHFHTLKNFTQGFGIEVRQLVGGLKKKARNQLLEEMAEGKVHIVVGTHALFQKGVFYHNLGFIVIDEQHRFGVEQRAELRRKALESLTPPSPDIKQVLTPPVPHILVMSATPIPRTLSMTVYGDLDVSVINELPKSRKPIKTTIVFESQLSTAYQFIRDEIDKGRQAYIVFPLVEVSEKIELKSAVEWHERLQSEIFPDKKVGLLHGQMFWYEKEDAMRDFKDRKFDILVATTVVEVGIDVPNASVMLIEHAERFGLAQLHQLRGRVGRGAEQSYCLLATKDHFQYQLSKKEEPAGGRSATIQRLKTMAETTDGFKIAEVDLQLRGPGDMLGTKQSGLPEFVFTDLVSDADAISIAKQAAFDCIELDPGMNKPEHGALRKEFIRRYRNDAGYLNIA